MTLLPRCLHTPVAILFSAALTGCVSVDPAAFATLPGDIMSMRGGISDLTRRPSSPHDVLRKVDRAMMIVATVHRYAALTTIQRQRVEQVVQRRYDGMVAKEKRALAPTYSSRKAEVRKRSQAKVAAARKSNPSAAAKAEKEAEQEIAQVDMEWDKAAKTSVKKNYGTDFAVPVSNSEGKPVVAFASVKDSGVKVSDSTYVVDSAPASLGSKTQVAHDGKKYAVLDEKVSL